MVNVYTSKPGVLIGKGGEGVNLMKEQIKKIAPGKQININIYEINRPDIDAQLVAESIAAQLEKRAAFRRTMKQAISRAMKGGAKGIKTMCSGRLDGAEIVERILSIVTLLIPLVKYVFLMNFLIFWSSIKFAEKFFLSAYH